MLMKIKEWWVMFIVKLNSIEDNHVKQFGLIYSINSYELNLRNLKKTKADGPA